MFMRKAMVGLSATACFLLGIWVAGGLLFPRSGAQAAHASSEATYILSDVNVSATDDMSAVAVSFVAEWSGDRFPGEVQCSLALFDGSGAQVGVLDFGATYTHSPARPPSLPVEVTAEPVMATGTCEPGAYADGAGYGFELQSVTGSRTGDSGSSRLGFATRWLTDADPGIRSCSLEVSRSEGATISYDFEFGAPDGGRLHQFVPVWPDDITAAEVTCTAL